MLQRKPLNQLGKRGLNNQESNRKLKNTYYLKGISTCEIHFPGCAYNNFLTFAHRHKRRDYYGKPEMLHSFNQTLLACVNCHNKIEYDKNLTKQMFLELRGPDQLAY
ncbi:MAG: hypothetical protein KCHDKBKB_00616 [Elusimicrobia bacterium]|nr:hypothetical protein [Elusimicrobiota bacterium]